MALSSSSSSTSSLLATMVCSLILEVKIPEKILLAIFSLPCVKKKIKTFIDEVLQKGDEISPAILNAIEGSKMSIIIFSKDYASSKWCLDELVKVLECKKLNSQIVVPVFYHVHPSDVRNQTGSFGKGFEESETNFKEMPEKVQNWRDALTEASYLSGHESIKFRNDEILVREIVKDVSKTLEDLTISIDFNGRVRIYKQIAKVKLLPGSPNFRIGGSLSMSDIVRKKPFSSKFPINLHARVSW